MTSIFVDSMTLTWLSFFRVTVGHVSTLCTSWAKLAHSLLHSAQFAQFCRSARYAFVVSLQIEQFNNCCRCGLVMGYPIIMTTPVSQSRLGKFCATFNRLGYRLIHILLFANFHSIHKIHSLTQRQHSDNLFIINLRVLRSRETFTIFFLSRISFIFYESLGQFCLALRVRLSGRVVWWTVAYLKCICIKYL